MVDNSLRADGSVPELGRRDGGGFGGRAGRVGPPERVHRDRIPSLRQLASLVVNGVLMLPRNYRRGMYLDILT